jgi:hypothetical protein
MVTGIFFCSCTSTGDEPPFSLGSGTSGDEIRRTSLKEMVSDPPGIVYEIQYARMGLTSSARLDFTTRAMLEEVFPGKWRVVYEYRDMRNKALKVPSAILIYKDQKGAKRLINRYDLVEMVPQEVARFRDKGGHSRLISYEYFDVMPEGPF